MRRLLTVLLALMLTVSLAACAAEPAGTTPPAGNGTVPPTQDGSETKPTAPGKAYTFTYGDLQMAVNAPAEPYITALGEPLSFTSEESCAFDGEDKTYYYGSFYLQTYPMGNQDFVYCLWLVDDTVSTEEGIYIGATQALVEKAYGAQWYNGRNAFNILTGDCNLLILLEDGVVTSIQYLAQVD